MLTAVTISLFGRSPALTGPRSIFIGRSTAGNIGIHIPDLPGRFQVGGIESAPNAIIADRIVIFYNVVKSNLEGRAGFTGRGIIIAGRGLGEALRYD